MVHVSSKVATLIISLAVGVSDAYELLPDDLDVVDRWSKFGFNVAISGDTVVVGAMRTKNDNDDYGVGSAYIFSASNGTKLHRLIADDRLQDDHFGVDVAISGDTVVVGAHLDDANDDVDGEDSGSAYIFSASDGTQRHKLVADDLVPGDTFGRSVAISGDTVVVGANHFAGRFEDGNEGFGSAYLFSASSGTQLHKLVPEDRAPCDWFGRVAAIDGDTVVIGAHQDGDYEDCPVDRMGSAYIFSASDGTQLHKLVPEDGAPGDLFGMSVAISGNIVVVGSRSDGKGTGPESGSAYLFSASDGTQLHKLVPGDGIAGDRFGGGVSISGNTVVVGAYKDNCIGSVYIFSASNGTQLAKLEGNSNYSGVCYDYFGESVAISDGTTVVGSPGRGTGGAAYVFSDWGEESSETSSSSNQTVLGEESSETSSSSNQTVLGEESSETPVAVETCDNCISGTFCNYDSGDDGFCEECSEMMVSDNCYESGLPDKGAKDCKQRCFESSSSSKSIALLMTSAAVLSWTLFC